MLGGPMPVRLPYSADESMLVTRRQNKLARDIDIINQKIRNNVLSRSEGATRIRFKQSEIDELQRYKSSKRVPTGRLSPPPRRQKVVQRSGKPANKYNPYATDKVNRATGPNMFDGGEMTFNRASPDKRQQAYQQSTSWTEDDRAGFTSRGNDRADGRKPPQAEFDGRNKRGFVESDYYSRFLTNYQTLKGKNPSSRERDGMESKATSYWRSNRLMPSKAKKSVQQQAKEQAQSVADKAKDAVSSWFSKAKSSSKNTPVAKTVKDNPHGRSFGPKLSLGEKFVSGNKAKKYGNTYYGPSAPQFAQKWEDWNSANGIAGFAGMPNHLIQSRSRALRDTALMRKRAGARINFDNPNTIRPHRSQASPRQVKRTPEQVSNLAGGLSKTRNSMQRLLK
jgi:type II secretory pathway component PulJ